MTEHIESAAVVWNVLHSYYMCRFLTLCVADPNRGVCWSSYSNHYSASPRLSTPIPQLDPIAMAYPAYQTRQRSIYVDSKLLTAPRKKQAPMPAPPEFKPMVNIFAMIGPLIIMHRSCPRRRLDYRDEQTMQRGTVGKDQGQRLKFGGGDLTRGRSYKSSERY